MADEKTYPPSRGSTFALIILSLVALGAGFVFQHVLMPAVFDRAVPSKITPTLIQTLHLCLWTAYGTAAFLLFFVVLHLAGALRGVRTSTWLFLIVLSAIALRFATPGIAFNSIVRPDGVHFSVVSQQLVNHGVMTVPTGDAQLPARTLPGESFVQVLTQWTNPAHTGQGIFAVWLCAVLTFGVTALVIRRFGGQVAMWLALVLLALSPLHGWYSRQLMSEIPWALCVLLSCGMIALGSSRPGLLFAAGLITGLGMTFKSSHLLIVLATLAGAVIALPDRARVRPRMAVFLAAGMLLGSIPAFLYNHAVLGGWLRTAYHIYWPGWASATEALNLKYLWAAPLIKGTMGNVPYYLLSGLGLDPRPERMPFLPGVLILLVVAAVMRARRPARDPSAYALFVRITLWVGVVYGLACFLYSFQDPRFLLPVIPLVMAALSLRLSRTLPGSTVTDSVPLKTVLIAVMAAVLGLGAAMIKVEAFGTRTPERLILEKLEQAAVDYDIIVSDEDPVLLTTFGVWSEDTQVLPLLLEGELWFPEDPADFYAEHGVAVKPFAGTVPLVREALQDGKRVGSYIRRPHDRPEAWRNFQEAFILTSADAPELPWLMTVRSRDASPAVSVEQQDAPPAVQEAARLESEEPGPQAEWEPFRAATQEVFTLGYEITGWALAKERSLPEHEVALSPFVMIRTEISAGAYAAFLNDAVSRDAVAVTESDAGFLVQWVASSNTVFPLCLSDTGEINNPLSFDPSNRVFTIATNEWTDMTEHPAVQVSWYGGAAYANWRSRADGFAEVYAFDDDGAVSRRADARGWRLPTEAEWEFTATWDGSKKRVYAWGDRWDPDLGNLAASSRHPRPPGMPFTVPVSEAAPWMPRPAAPEEPLHLTGNVWEWCHDWFSEYEEEPTINPAGPAQGSLKVLRGGSYRTHQPSAWAAFRGIAPPEMMTPDIGFRIARRIGPGDAHDE